MASVAIQRFVARTILSLPSPILRLMSGGGVAYVGGRTLDPRLQFLAVQSRNAPPINSLSPQDVRRGEAARRRWEARFSFGTMIDAYRGLYRDLLGHSRTGAPARMAGAS